MSRLLKYRLQYLLLRSISLVLQPLPKRWTLSLGALLGRLSFRLIRRRRQIAISNLTHAFGETCSEAEIQRTALASFQEMGKTFVEFLCFPRWVRQGLDRHVTVVGSEHVRTALTNGQGAVVFIGHLGNWELQALVYGQLTDQPSAIAFPLKNPYLNAWVNRYRGLTGLDIISKRGAARQVFRHLHANRQVGFIADQNAGREGVFVRLFDRMASSSRGPVTFALRTGAPILLSFDERLPNGYHRLTISSPFYPMSTGDMEADVQTNTQHLMAALEEVIRANPTQWMWMHDRWKSRPDPAWNRTRAQRRGYEAAAAER